MLLVKIIFGVVSSKNDKLCTRKSSLSSLYLSLVKTKIGDQGKVAYLHNVCCACLAFLLKLSWMATL